LIGTEIGMMKMKKEEYNGIIGKKNEQINGFINLTITKIMTSIRMHSMQ